MAPTTSITQLATAAETALATYSADQSQIATDNTNLSAAQAKLAADTTQATTDGQSAYAALAALDQAIQAQMATLPQPAPAPATGN